MLEGMQEVIGKSDLQAFITRSVSPAGPIDRTDRLSFKDLCEFQEAVETSFGPNGGRGLLCRSGRASFKHLLPGFWEALGMTNLQYRLLPTPTRIRVGLRAMAKALSAIYEEEITTADESEAWTWSMAHCPLCFGRETRGPVCDFAVGLLQEFLSWASSGRMYFVEETECIGAGGTACCITISKKPLD